MATARAVAAMPVLTEYCLPFVKQGGVFAANERAVGNGGAGRSSGEAAGRRDRRRRKLYSPTAGERKLIRIRKTAPTPQKYPRRSDKIKKQPLG